VHVFSFSHFLAISSFNILNKTFLVFMWMKKENRIQMQTNECFFINPPAFYLKKRKRKPLHNTPSNHRNPALYD